MPASNTAYAVSNAYDRSHADPSASAEASTRAKFSLDDRQAAAGDAAAPPATASGNPAPTATADSDPSIPDPARMLAMLGATSGPNAAGSLGSAPATLAMMSDIAVASGSGTLSDAQRGQLQQQYAQLQAQFATTVAAAGQAQAAADRQRDSDTGDDAQSTDDRRSTRVRDVPQAAQVVQGDPQVQLVRTTTLVQVDANSAPPKTPTATVLSHELHVGADSYEPVAVRQTQTRFTRPAEFAQFEEQSTTHRVAIAHVMQIREIAQAAPVQQLSVVA